MSRKDYLAFGKPNFSEMEIDAVTRVMRSGWVGAGPETISFERELEEYLGGKHVISVNSCTSALFLSLLVSGVGEGDEVICPSLTWCSTANAARYLGADVRFCDVDIETLCATTDSILAKVTERTKVVVFVHMGGLAADVATLRERLPKHVAIVEDAAHALGSTYPNGIKVGSSGNLTCFSFYANKNLSTGDGGAISLNDTAQGELLQSLRHQGLPADAWKRYSHPQSAFMAPLEVLGYKMNFTDLQACIGRVQLKRQKELSAIRHAVASLYVDRLKGMRRLIGVQPGIDSEAHARHLFVIRLPTNDMKLTRNEVFLAMRSKNVGVSIHYPPLHLMPLYASGRSQESLPNTERLDREILTLPISSSMNLDDANYVMDQLEAFIS